MEVTSELLRSNPFSAGGDCGPLSLPAVAVGAHHSADKVLGVLEAEGFQPERVSGWRRKPAEDRSSQVFGGQLVDLAGE